jgi:hypothetical protein
MVNLEEDPATMVPRVPAVEVMLSVELPEELPG